MNPEFRSASFLRQHMADIVEFYRPNAMDPRGGYHHNYFDDGQIFEADKKHLVSSCRMIFNFCAAQEISGDSRFEIFWQHGLRFLREHHWQNERQGYVWTFADGQPEDETNHCYGLAFVMLAYAACLMRGEESARADIYHTYELLEKHFWQPEAQLYADEISPDSCRLWDMETNEKLDKDRFRRDMGGVTEAYAEVASRLGIIKTSTDIADVIDISGERNGEA